MERSRLLFPPSSANAKGGIAAFAGNRVPAFGTLKVEDIFALAVHVSANDHFTKGHLPSAIGR